MKDTILWLQLKPRCQPDGNYLYSSIQDIKQWIVRISRLKKDEQEARIFSLLLEINELDIAVNERLLVLESLHQPVMMLIDHLSKKYMGSGLPLAEDKARYVQKVNSFWSEMATGYKIVIDDLSESSFLTSFINQKDLSCALYHVMFYLSGQLYSNYALYSACTENVWRDIHQVFRFAAKRKLATKSINADISVQLTIIELYKKILLFSLANPYHLTFQEMKLIWEHLDHWSLLSDLNTDSKKVFKKAYPFIIQSYSDRSPFVNAYSQTDMNKSDLTISLLSSTSIWGFNAKKLIKQLAKKNKNPGIPNYLINALLGSWSGGSDRASSRRELIEPVVLAFGVSNISHFLTQINMEPKLLKFESEEIRDLRLSSSVCSLSQAYLIDESVNGFRLKLNQQKEKSVLPVMGEVVAVKHSENGVHIGYLRWIRENKNAEIEFGIEHLSAMAEAVQLTKSNNYADIVEQNSDKNNVLDSFVFPGGEEYNYKPILFTHTFIEKFYNIRNDHLMLHHKTGSINIKLVQKVNETLGYSLYLFEKALDD